MIIENDGEGLADIIARHPRESGCALAVELEIDGALADSARPVVVSCIGIDEIVAADDAPPYERECCGPDAPRRATA